VVGLSEKKIVSVGKSLMDQEIKAKAKRRQEE